MTKNKLLISMMLIMSLVLFGCTSDDVAEEETITKTVETMNVSESETEVVLSYYGYVTSDQMTNLSFKSSGILKALNVKKGDVVAVGDTIASLDQSDYQIQIDAANAGVLAVKASYLKADQAYQDAVRDYENYLALYNAGSVSKTTLDKITLSKDVAEADQMAAKEAYEQAQHNLKALEQTVSDLTMVSKVSGVVIETPFEVNEAVSAGYPVVVLRSEASVFKTSVAQKDLNKLFIGQTARMTLGDDVIEGLISEIGNTPDESTRTYDVEIAFEGNVPLGTVGEVDFITDSIVGISLPLEIVMNSDEHYVFVIRDGVAYKQNVTIDARVDNALIVSGLNEGDEVVLKGYTRLNEMDQVNVLGGEDQ